MNILASVLFVTSFVVYSVHCTPTHCTERFFAVPGDCESYYDCVYGKPQIMPCAEGTRFNEKIKTCDWPHEVDCDEIPKGTPTEPSTPKSTLMPLPAPLPDDLRPYFAEYVHR